MTPTSLVHGFPFRAYAFHMRPHSSVISQYRNLNLLSIGYVFRPGLRPRLTQSRSALLWKPWIFGRKDSHLPLATHSGILSSIHSTAPFGTASSRMQCSSTNPLGFSPHPPVSVYGTGTVSTIAAFLDAWFTDFATLFRSASRLPIATRICQSGWYPACTGLSIPGFRFPYVSPQFCHTAVQESPPVVHRLRLSSSP